MRASRGRLPRVAWWLLSLAAPALLLSCGGELPPPRPDLLLVVWDTCRGDRVGVNGYGRDTTPVLDDLAAGGVTYRRCYSPAPWTPPAHGSLFTGLLPRHHGLIEGMGDRIRPGIPALAETLREAGYETVCVSANPLISDATGLNAGFERELPCYRTGEDGVTGDAALERVRQWLGIRRSGSRPRRPFFLFVNLMDCHLPYVYDAAAVTATHGTVEGEGVRQAAAAVGDMETKLHLVGVRPLLPDRIRDLGVAYDGAVRRNDRTTGRLLDLLRGEGLLENAMVAVCGDHGENLGEHGEMNHIFSVHETVCRVPLVLVQPGRFEGGAAVDAPVALQDLYPTLLAAAGVGVPPPCGRDAVPLSPVPPDRVLLSEFGPLPLSLLEAPEAFPGISPKALERFHFRYRAARRRMPEGGMRAYLHVVRVGEDGTASPVWEALFDPEADPGEERNLLERGGDPREREVADALRALSEEP